MKTEPVRPARLEIGADGVPSAPDFGDVYHSRAGALAQARHVFLAGNGLPGRWAGRPHFTVLETGFGFGHNFIATWQAWRADPRRCDRLHYVGIEKHPPTPEDLARVHAALPVDDPALRELQTALRAQWPLPVAGLHPLSFDDGRVQLLLALHDVRAVLPELVLQADAVYLDGFAPARNPAMWEPRVLKAIGRRAAPGATAATWSAAAALRAGLLTAGFAVEKRAGLANKREMVVARFAPPQGRRPGTAAGRVVTPAAAGETVAVVGAGIAGCATAWALARLGLRVLLLDRHEAPAAEASGQAAGLFHGVVTPDDGPHARFHRAAALATARTLASLGPQRVGWAPGLLRLDRAGGDAESHQAALDRLGLPAAYVQAVDAQAAATIAGVPLDTPAWHYPGGGTVSAPALARAFLAAAGQALEWRGRTSVEALQRDGDHWQLLGPQSLPIARCRHVVLAGAHDVLRLLAPWIPSSHWPLQRRRGQTSSLPLSRWQALGLPLPRCALAGSGYLLPAAQDRMLFGATSQPGDEDGAVRADDHAHNLSQLAVLLGRPLPPVDAFAPGELQGRVGWRLSADDRLPLIGPVPDLAALPGAGTRAEQPRFLPRLAGLHLHTALGSRGLGTASLGGQVIAALIAGTPVPLESGLLDAIDPARFASRQARRGPGAGSDAATP